MIQVREYALFTSDHEAVPSLDMAVVSEGTFDWLKSLKSSWSKSKKKILIESAQYLKIGSYVGFLQSPDGTEIEILPKTQDSNPCDAEISQNRALLLDMVLSSLRVKPREGGPANLTMLDTPIHEWIFSQFLKELSELYKRGFRNDYQNIEEENRFIKGQFNVARQVRQPPGRNNYFHIRYDVFTPDILENKVLKSALDFVFKQTKDSDNWRLANELRHQLIDLEASKKPVIDISRWRNTRLLHNYKSVYPWCNLIINMLNPAFQSGSNEGISLLFPMERLFENYVESCLKQQLKLGCKIQGQASSKYLVTHQASGNNEPHNWFLLKPDLLLTSPSGISVMDAKWKRLDSSKSSTEHKYNISQSDLYQLYAYGQKYMDGKGAMMLIYPKRHSFDYPLPVFRFDDDLQLWVVPFDLYEKSLVKGEWLPEFPGLSCA